MRLGAVSGSLVLLLLWTAAAQGQNPAAAARMQGGGRLRTAADLPRSKLRSRIEALPTPARDRAIQWLNRFEFPPEDLSSLKAANDGSIYYVCEFPAATNETPASAASEPQEAAIPVSPFPNSLKFHSRAGSTNILYLDFNGAVVSNTQWNISYSQTVFLAVAYSLDGDYGTYSDAEQRDIKRIWERVSEDFAIFNIDVTTEPPAVTNIQTAQALITRNTDSLGHGNPASSAGGVAYINVFGDLDFVTTYSPAFVYQNNLSQNEGNIAEAASHEIGHNMGLSHDGQTNGVEYYGGHGSGDTTWAPIMGVGYGENVTQWSKGEYFMANNAQNDLNIIATRTALLADLVGGTVGAASSLIVSGNVFITSTTPETDPANSNPANKGIIERTNDVDVFAFASGAGNVNITVSPWISPSNTRGGNLDIKLSLMTASSNVLVNTNPIAATTASLSLSVTAGTYFLVISNSSFGTPQTNAPSGYTPYASLGQYFISGTVPGAFTNPLNVVAAADGPELVRLSWLSLGFDGLVAHNTGTPPAKPVNGTAYSSGANLSTGRVVFKGAASEAEHVTPPGTTNYYVFYTVGLATNYSIGVTSIVITAPYPNGIVEAFCYTNGVSLAGKSGGAGFTNAWQTNGIVYAVTNGPAGNFAFDEPHPRLSEQRLAMDVPVNGTNIARRRFATMTNGTLYIAYRIAIEFGGGAKYSGMRLLLTNGAEGIYIGETGDSDLLGIDGYGGLTVNSAYNLNSYQFFSENAYVVAGRYDFATRRIDVTAYYRTQTIPEDEPLGWQASATAAVDRTAINGLELIAAGFSGGTPGRVFFDEVRVASSWRGLFLDLPTSDSDGDGMSDTFELTYFGSATAGDPAVDADGDGFSNYDEFTASTSPTNGFAIPPNPWPRVLGTGGSVIVSGDSSPTNTDGTDFGSALPCSDSIEHNFSVTNLGLSTLNISNVVVRGHTNDFTVLSAPPSIVGNGRSNLLIRFDPSAFGVRTASVEITHSSSAIGPYRFGIRGTGSAVVPAAALVVAPASPFISGDAGGADQNNIGDRYDLVTNGTPLQATDACGFGSWGRVYLNYDATNLYVGGEGLDLTADENGAVLFLGMNTLTDDALNASKGLAFSNPPFALNLLKNLNFSSPVDVAILIGDEYGDVLDREFLLANGINFGQGVYYLSSDYFPISSASISQFDGLGTNATVTADDDGNRRTERWEVAIPWVSLNAPAGPASLTNLTVVGVLLGGTLFDTRYISGNYLAAGSSRSPDQYSDGNIGFDSVTLTPYTVALPTGDFDTDGIPDSWESQHGLSAVAFNSPASDIDSDGLSDRDEYVADTHPTNGASFFPAITNLAGTGVTTLNVSPTSTGRVYDVLWKTNLLPDSLPWNPYGFNLPGSGSGVVLSVTNTTTERYLRTGVKLP